MAGYTAGVGAAAREKVCVAARERAACGKCAFGVGVGGECVCRAVVLEVPPWELGASALGVARTLSAVEEAVGTDAPWYAFSARVVV